MMVGDFVDVSETHSASIFRVGFEDWGSLYLRNVVIIAHKHKVPQLKYIININNYTPCKPKIST
jgi:hypothetical protein